MNNATFAFNTSVASGGAVANFNNGSLYLQSCAFDYDSATDYGGGFYDGQGHISWAGITYSGNHAGAKGPNYYIA